MKKIKVADATNEQLNWLVAKCEGFSEFDYWHTGAITTRAANGLTLRHHYAEDWAQGGPIIEREWICPDRLMNRMWLACKRNDAGDSMLYAQQGPTPLIAAMRCYVASKLGAEVEVPEELA